MGHLFPGFHLFLFVGLLPHLGRAHLLVVFWERERVRGEKIFEISWMWENIFILPSHLKDKLVECKILGLQIIFLKHVKILFLCPMIFSIIFEKSGHILLPGCDLWSLWKFVGFAFCPVSWHFLCWCTPCFILILTLQWTLSIGIFMSFLSRKFSSTIYLIVPLLAELPTFSSRALYGICT